MNEREVQGALVKGANLEGWRLFKIVDGAIGKRPFDISGVFGPYGIALEVKSKAGSWDSVAALPWADFAPHQVSWLRAYAEAGAIALVAIHDTDTDGVKIYVLTPSEFSLSKSRTDIPHVWLSLNRKDGLYHGWGELSNIITTVKG